MYQKVDLVRNVTIWKMNYSQKIMLLISLICYIWNRTIEIQDYESVIDKFGFNEEGFFSVQFTPRRPLDQARAFVSITLENEQNAKIDNNEDFTLVRLQ